MGDLDGLKAVHSSMPTDRFISYKNYDNGNMLSAAISHGQQEIIEYLFKCGIDVNKASNVRVLWTLTLLEWGNPTH